MLAHTSPHPAPSPARNLCLPPSFPHSPHNHGPLRHRDSKCRLQVEAWLEQSQLGTKLPGWGLRQLGRRLGSKGLSFTMPQALDTGLCSGRAEDTVGLFPWQDERRWDTGTALHFYSNKSRHTATSHALIREMPSSGSRGRAPLPLATLPC